MIDDPSIPVRFDTNGGRMGRMVQELDWAATPLGPVRGWPPELIAVVHQILGSGFPAAVIWGPDFTTIYNDAFRPILGDKLEALGRSFADIWAEAWDEIGPIARRAYAGEATFIEDFPLTIDRSGQPEQAWFTFSYSPLRAGDGQVMGFIDTVVETTATVKARADLALLNDELGHRLKNTLALVQVMATQTLRGSAEQDALVAFQRRLLALGQAHDVLLRQNWTEAALVDLVRGTLAPLDGLDQIAIEGPDVVVGPHTAISLSLVLHELATNAIKYGALSVAAGQVALDWEAVAEADSFVLRWRERNGPPVTQPSHTGFGSRLIERGLGGGTVRRAYAAGGLELELAVPLRQLRN